MDVRARKSFDQAEVCFFFVLVFLSAVAPHDTYSLGSHMMEVQISRIIRGQLEERADRLSGAKSYM